MKRCMLQYTVNFIILTLFTSRIIKADVDPILIKGSKFFYATNGSQFFIRGILYDYLGRLAQDTTAAIDSLQDEVSCARDIPHLLKLGINTVVLDRFNANVDHSGCLKLLQESGIYVLGRLYESPYYRKNGQTWFEFDYNLFDRYKAIVDSLQNYSNILGLYMSFDDDRVEWLSNLPFKKAFTRDIKAYIKSKRYRTIPVGGYVQKHGMSTSIAQFWGCGNGEITADFLLVEATEESDTLGGDTWCTNSSADYSELIGRYRSFQVPLVFNYGCNQSLPHGYEELQQIYRDDVIKVFSGVIISEWFSNKRRSGDKGIIEIDSDLNINYRPGYFSLSKQLALLQPTPVQRNNYMPVYTELPCYNLNITEALGKRGCNCPVYGGGEINTVLPFTPNARACSCMLQSIDCVIRPGLDEETIRNSERDMCAKNHILCSATRPNISEGLYPSYIFCNNTESLSWELQQQYLLNNNDSTACSSAGGVIQQAIPMTSLASDCKEFLRQAGPDGTGTITFTPTSTIQSNSLNSQPSGLKTRAKIGIGVGVGSFGILTATLLALYWRVKRGGRSSSQLDEYQKAELPDNSVVVPIVSEILLDGAEINELEGATAELDHEQVNELRSIQVNEIDGGQIVELDGASIDREAQPK